MCVKAQNIATKTKDNYVYSTSLIRESKNPFKYSSDSLNLGVICNNATALEKFHFGIYGKYGALHQSTKTPILCKGVYNTACETDHRIKKVPLPKDCKVL